MNEKLREKYRPFIHSKGGVFGSIVRKRLLGLSPGGPGWTEETSDFRYNVRTYVKSALKDLELFIEVVDKGDMNKVLNVKSLMPIIEALLTRS